MVDRVRELYPFQRQAVRFIEQTNGRTILGDEMGLGKTVEALHWAGKRSDITKILIVSPANVTYKWQREVKTWLGRNSAVVQGYSSKLTRHPILICSYNVMTHRWKELRKRGFDLIIWDEAHYLKGNRKKTKRVAAALRLKSPFVLCLSGTPFLNRPIELFNILTILEPGKWKLGSYGTRYCGGFDHWEGPLKGATNRHELKSKLTSIMIRRLKRDVLDDLPPLSRILLPVEIRQTEYKKAMKEMNREFPMRAVMDMWHIIGNENAKEACHWANDFMEQSDGKLVLYAHHNSVVKLLDTGLRQHGVAIISGQTPVTKRDALVKGFQIGERPRIMIITNAGGEGIDLFGLDGVDASTILFVERQWTPAMEEQALARLDRIGQNSPVTAYYLVAIGTFDEKMATRIEIKRKVLDDIVGEPDVTMNIKDEILDSIF